MKRIVTASLIISLAMLGCYSLESTDGVSQDTPNKDPGMLPFQPLDAGGQQDASPDTSDGGHKCKGLCTPHYGWIYDCEGPPKVNCQESLEHSCHADMCPSVCVLTPGQDAGGIVSVGCLPAPAPPPFTWSSLDDAGQTVTNACNMPGGCPSGSTCQLPYGTNFLTGTCL